MLGTSHPLAGFGVVAALPYAIRLLEIEAHVLPLFQLVHGVTCVGFTRFEQRVTW